MTINNAEAFVRNIWDWSILDGCFGNSRIKPTDIDGSTERNSQYLFIETKEPDVPVKQGQDIFFGGLARKPGITVAYIWGDPGLPEYIQILRGNRRGSRRPCTLTQLRAVVSRWYSFADRGYVPSLEDLENAL